MNKIKKGERSLPKKEKKVVGYKLVKVGNKTYEEVPIYKEVH